MRKEWLEKDYYATLGVAKDASQKEIKKAFRNLARESHPDNNPGDATAEARFKEINEAYDTIGDDETRKEYDHARDMGYFVGGPGGGQQYVRVEDLFGGPGGGTQDLFGGFQDLFTGGRRQPRKGADLTGSVHLSFHEALQGATRELSVNGKSVKVKIPKGISSGTKVRVKGKGAPGSNGGPAGDLYVEVTVGSHPIFGRTGNRNLTIEVPISYPEATLGATISVPTLDGATKIKVPPGTTSGTTLKLSGKGVETSSGKGDLLVTLVIAVNPNPGSDEREALTALRTAEADWNPRARLGTAS
ncbi:MAG: DnaJ domain-containing protein [Acidimicrobiia bacterium]|nr:DnaJ domain-containing protein [Acidimicrobiia bacterium]